MIFKRAGLILDESAMSIKKSNLALATKLAFSTLQSSRQCEADLEKDDWAAISVC